MSVRATRARVSAVGVPAACGLLLAAALVAGCTSNGAPDHPHRTPLTSSQVRAVVPHPSTRPSGIGFHPPPLHGHGVTSCGPAYLVQRGRHTAAAGGCAGILPREPIKVTVPVGSVFYVRVAHEMGGGLDYPVPQPTNGSVRLLARRGPIVQYQAVAVGSVDLLARHTMFCAATDPKVGSCVAVHLEITR